MIGSIHAKVASGATSAKAALTTERNHLELVTPDWLKACLLAQTVVKVGLFKPEAVKTSADALFESGPGNPSSKLKANLQYRVKQNIFMG